jgi:hypothetical protein
LRNINRSVRLISTVIQLIVSGSKFPKHTKERNMNTHIRILNFLDPTYQSSQYYFNTLFVIFPGSAVCTKTFCDMSEENATALGYNVRLLNNYSQQTFLRSKSERRGLSVVEFISETATELQPCAVRVWCPPLVFRKRIMCGCSTYGCRSMFRASRL